jgi:SAM-dependent methyltransferase
MPADYAVLAPIYQQIGMGNFALEMTPRLINYAQRHEWMGRRILDLGCGTGVSLKWLAEHSYMVTGIDNSPQILELAQKNMSEAKAGVSYTLRERDIRELGSDVGVMDMVLALDVMNELNSLRDLEIIFKQIFSLLDQNRLFIFDMHTIQGLTKTGSAGDSIVYNTPHLAVFSSNQYDYERQIHERHFIIFHRRDDVWLRNEASRVLRAFPTQAVGQLLVRCGFQTVQVMNLDFEPFEPGTNPADRVIFVAEKH